MTPPRKKEGRTIELSLPGVVGLFKWTLLAENRHIEEEPKDQSRKTRSIAAWDREAHHDSGSLNR